MKQNSKFSLSGSKALLKGKRMFRALPLMAAGLIACTFSARAADSPGVKFNSGVRYSQWAIDSRLYDFKGNKNQFGFAKWDASSQKLGSYTKWSSPKNDYVAGLVGKATLEAAEFYNTDWSKPWFESAKGYALDKINYSSSSDAQSITLDNMNAAKMFIPLTKGNSEWITSEEQNYAKNYISEVIKDLVTYNSKLFIGSAFYNSSKKWTGISADKANELGMYGSWYHKPVYVDQTWCDGMYMGPALLAQIIEYNGKTNNLSATENDWDILTRQFTISWEQLHDGTTGLMYHGFTANPGVDASADWAGVTKGGTTYHSASFWGRANAWYFMALVDVLEAMPTDNSNYATLKGYLTSLASAIKNYQDSETGCWYQVLDKTPASLTGNYLEASCSSIFTAAYLKAIRLGLLDKATYESVAKKAYEGLVNQFMVYDNTDNSTVQLVHSCTSAGLGNGRTGDDNYYINGTSDAKYVTSANPNGKVGNEAMYYTEGKVLGGFIMAATEYERAYQNQDSKQILFARDLAPEYDFSTTEGTLDATAYGSATPTYQWYKDGSAIADATSSTYSPTESGTYKCTATANGTTITTSEAVVTAKANTGGEEKPTTNSTLFEYTFPTSGTGTDTELANYGTISYNSITFDANGCALKDDKKYVQIALKNNTIKEGDIITVKTYSTSGETSGIIAKTESNGATTICSVTSKNTTETSSYTVKASDAIVGSSILKLFRNTKTTYLSYIKITRAGSDTPTTKKYVVTASVNPTEGGNMHIYNGDEELTSGAEVESGTNVKFSVIPNKDYAVTGWTVNGVAQNTTGTELTVAVKEATTVVANVEQAFNVYGTTKNGGSSSVAIECNGKAFEHGATLHKGSTVKFTAIPAQGYKFVKWVNGENESEELGTSNPLVVESLSKDFNARAVFEEEGSGTVTTTTATVTFPATGLKTLDSDATESGQVPSLTTEAITITAGKGISANTTGLKVTSGGVADFTISANGAKITKIILVTNASGRSLTSDPEGTKTNNNKTWTYDFSTTKPSSIKFTNASSSNINVTEIQVEYESSTPSTPKTDLKATYAAQSIDATVGDVNLTAPELTVMADETALTAEQYAVSYASSATDVVRVEEDGSLTAAHKGTATITATITPADGTKYNSTTATFTVNANARQLKASFSPAAVDAKEDDEARDLPTLSVIDVKTTQPVSDFTATYTSNDENVVKIVDNKLVFTGVGKTTVKAAVTPTLQTVYDGCEATFEVSVAKKQSDIDPTKDNVVYDFLQNVGTEVAGVEQIKINEGENIMFGTNFKAVEKKYLTVGADGDGGFKAGDKITIKGKCLKANSGILIYANPTDAEPQFQSPAFSATEVTYTFTVQKDCDKLYFGRFGGSSTYVTGLTIVRPGTTDEKIRLTAAFAKNSDVIINKVDNYTVDLPALTVKAGDEELTSDNYTVAYTSNDEDIATVAGGKITVKTTGTVTILATVNPKDANKYEGCTATYTITVKDQTPLSISVNDVNINVTDANYKQPIIKVYGDDDKLLTLGTDYTLSYTIDGSNVSVASDNTLKVAGEKYNWTEGTSTITVTATPTPSLGETFKAGTMTFLYNVVKGKLTPAFLASFTTTGEAIKIKQYNKDTNKNDKTFRVPLIYDGEDVSEYFKYTYKVTDTDGAEVTNKNNKTNGNEFTFRPDKEGNFTINVSATPTTKDGDDYSDVYNTPAAISFKVNVSSTYIRPVITFNPETMQMYTGTTEGAPDVIVTDGTKELEEGTDYSIKWISFTPSFVKVDETSGKLEAVNEGNGSVRVTVKGENLETMTAFLTVYVDDPAVYRAKDKDNDGVAVAYGNQKQMWNQDRTLSVTLGGWMFPNDVTEGLKYDSREGLKKGWKWADKASQPKWKMSGFNRYVSGEDSKNARQEDGSNAQVNTTMISTADFKTKGTVVDRMFNVPCSGSYLVFNPVTNGTVNVHIFQNGAFDSGVYRPQRRVFVMDEQGNFVQSTPEIENANGKPTGGVKALSNYKWDINPNGANTAPTIEQVRSHFKGIPADFEMTEDRFQNNVLESNLSAEIVPNAAYDETVEGSNGWCVLADSPVTYTFNVKAGKTYYLWNFGSKIGFYGFSFEEDATKPVVDKVVYKEEATDNQIVSTAAGHMAKVSINRHIKQGIWNTCVLPFSLNKHQVDALFGDTYMMGCENGTQILYFDHVDANGKVWFVRHAYNTIVANKPFLIKPTKDVEVINTADCADYPYVTIEAPDGNKPADWCSDGKYAWVSSYNKDMEINEGDGYIGGNTGSFIQYKGNTATMNGFRGYLKGLTAEAKTHALSTATSSNTEENGSTTFIEGLTIDSEGNIVPVATDGKVYNISGQVVANDMKSLNSLPSGVYVINGKKYVK